jgi:hypothetical protein
MILDEPLLREAASGRRAHVLGAGQAPIAPGPAGGARIISPTASASRLSCGRGRAAIC